MELLSEGWRSVSLFSDSLRFPISVNVLCCASLSLSLSLSPSLFRTRRFVLTRCRITRYCFRPSRLQQRPIGFLITVKTFCAITIHLRKEDFQILRLNWQSFRATWYVIYLGRCDVFVEIVSLIARSSAAEKYDEK